MTTDPLPDRAREVYRYMQACVESTGKRPSVSEMVRALGVSRASIQLSLITLTNSGYAIPETPKTPRPRRKRYR